MYIDTIIHSVKKQAIAKNMNIGTRMVWHFCWVNYAVVFMTAVAILNLLKLHNSISKDTPATPQHT